MKTEIEDCEKFLNEINYFGGTLKDLTEVLIEAERIIMEIGEEIDDDSNNDEKMFA